MVKIMLSDFKLYLFSIKVLYCKQCIVILNNLLSILVCIIAEYLTQIVRRITNEILEVKGLSSATLFLLFIIN